MPVNPERQPAAVEGERDPVVAKKVVIALVRPPAQPPKPATKVGASKRAALRIEHTRTVSAAVWLEKKHAVCQVPTPGLTLSQRRRVPLLGPRCVSRTCSGSGAERTQWAGRIGTRPNTLWASAGSS